jgi:uncharacterized protein YcnI
MFRLSLLGCAFLSAFFSLPAFAHITLEQSEAPVGAPYKAVFRVPHGCDGSSTTKLTVQIPEGVIAVKPMVKSGWEIETKRGPYAKSYSYFHGAKFDQGVKEVTWSAGRLPDAFYDEFVLSVFIAGDLAAGQTLYFPVIQNCEKGEHRWIEVPSADKHGKTENDPAPALRLVPKK